MCHKPATWKGELGGWGGGGGTDVDVATVPVRLSKI